jgi:hypothetical protein
MNLKEELKELTGKKRRFLLFRIAEVEAEPARQLCGVTQGSYNNWVGGDDTTFTQLYRRLDELTVSYKQEAIQMLRRDNQLAAVLLEEKIISKMKAEIDSGEYNLIRTNLARDVYTKLIGDLDVVPATQVQTWQQKVQQIFMGNSTPTLGAPNEIIETVSCPVPELRESIPVQKGEQTSSQEQEENPQ